MPADASVYSCRKCGEITHFPPLDLGERVRCPTCRQVGVFECEAEVTPEPVGDTSFASRFPPASKLVAANIALASAAAALAFLLLGAIGYSWMRRGAPVASSPATVSPASSFRKPNAIVVPATLSATPQPKGGEARKPLLDYAVPLASEKLPDMVARVMPSVVTIETATGNGSGFFVHDNQTVATNHHVIAGEESATIRLHDGKLIAVAGCLVADVGKDWAMLHLEHAALGIVPLPLSLNEPKLAETVVAIGAPKGLSGSVSDGIVAGIRRGSEIDLLTANKYTRFLGHDPDARWIQTTAPISPGNSGGPLLNLLGEVVGINSWQNAAPNSQNLNFALSVAHLRSAVKSPPVKYMTLNAVPAAPPTQVDADRGRAEREQQDRQRAAIAAAEQARAKAIEAINNASQSAAQQSELNRLTAQLLQVRRELTEIEREGTQLTRAFGEVQGSGKGVFLLGAQVAQSIAATTVQLNYWLGCARRRQAVVNGQLAVLDDCPAPYTIVGLAQVQAECAARESALAILRTEAAAAEAEFVKLNTEARGLQVQITYKAQKRAEKQAELQQLTDQLNALSARP